MPLLCEQCLLALPPILQKVVIPAQAGIQNWCVTLGGMRAYLAAYGLEYSSISLSVLDSRLRGNDSGGHGPPYALRAALTIIFAARSTSSSVVYRPRLNRTVPSASSGDTPIADSTGDTNGLSP